MKLNIIASSAVFKEYSSPYGCLIMTGTGMIPGDNFILQKW